MMWHSIRFGDEEDEIFRFFDCTRKKRIMPNGVRFLSNIAKVSPLSDTPVKQQKQKEKNGKKYGKNARIRFKTQPSKEKKTEPPKEKKKTERKHHHETLSGMDSYIYSMTSDENSMIITGALLTEGIVMNRQGILDRIRERVVEKHERFRCTIVDGGAKWKPCFLRSRVCDV